MGPISCLKLGILGAALVATSCSGSPRISAGELESVVRRDGLVFTMTAIPDHVLELFESHRIVVIGEKHFLSEHRQLVVELLRRLHERGFRQLLFEWTQAADWLLDDYVLDGGLEPEWEPPLEIGGDMIAAIRDFNRTLLPEERIRVRPIDVTLPDYGGARSFVASLAALTKHLVDPGPLSGFLDSGYHNAPDPSGMLLLLQNELIAKRPHLISSWGSRWYEVATEMVAVELDSLAIRAIRDTDYDKSVRLREDAIKRLVDARVKDFPYRSLINIGSTHAQKERLWGTRIEWLGDYLAHRSTAVSGTVLVVEVSAARVASAPGSSTPDFDLGRSPENELMRTVSRVWPDEMVLLPLDDGAFSSRTIPMNVSGELHLGSPAKHFDAVILLPLAHRIALK